MNSAQSAQNGLRKLAQYSPIILTLLAYALAGLLAFAALRTDVAVLRRDLDQHEEAQAAQRLELNQRLDRLESKIDRLVEKPSK